MGDEFSMQVDGQTDITKLIFTFRNFMNASEKILGRIFKLCLHFRTYFDGGILERVAV
jgi:hypothetical protein